MSEKDIIKNLEQKVAKQEQVITNMERMLQDIHGCLFGKLQLAASVSKKAVKAEVEKHTKASIVLKSLIRNQKKNNRKLQ